MAVITQAYALHYLVLHHRVYRRVCGDVRTATAAHCTAQAKVSVTTVEQWSSQKSWEELIIENG